MPGLTFRQKLATISYEDLIQLDIIDTHWYLDGRFQQNHLKELSITPDARVIPSFAAESYHALFTILHKKLKQCQVSWSDPQNTDALDGMISTILVEFHERFIASPLRVRENFDDFLLSAVTKLQRNHIQEPVSETRLSWGSIKSSFGSRKTSAVLEANLYTILFRYLIAQSYQMCQEMTLIAVETQLSLTRYLKTTQFVLQAKTEKALGYSLTAHLIDNFLGRLSYRSHNITHLIDAYWNIDPQSDKLELRREGFISYQLETKIIEEVQNLSKRQLKNHLLTVFPYPSLVGIWLSQDMDRLFAAHFKQLHLDEQWLKKFKAVVANFYSSAKTHFDKRLKPSTFWIVCNDSQNYDSELVGRQGFNPTVYTHSKSSHEQLLGYLDKHLNKLMQVHTEASFHEKRIALIDFVTAQLSYDLKPYVISVNALERIKSLLNYSRTQIWRLVTSDGFKSALVFGTILFPLMRTLFPEGATTIGEKFLWLSCGAAIASRLAPLAIFAEPLYFLAKEIFDLYRADVALAIKMARIMAIIAGALIYLVTSLIIFESLGFGLVLGNLAFNIFNTYLVIGVAALSAYLTHRLQDYWQKIEDRDEFQLSTPMKIFLGSKAEQIQTFFHSESLRLKKSSYETPKNETEYLNEQAILLQLKDLWVLVKNQDHSKLQSQWREWFLNFTSLRVQQIKSKNFNLKSNYQDIADALIIQKIESEPDLLTPAKHFLSQYNINSESIDTIKIRFQTSHSRHLQQGYVIELDQAIAVNASITVLNS